jgi:hypothetical protein
MESWFPRDAMREQHFRLPTFDFRLDLRHNAIELTNQTITVLDNTAIVRHDLAGTRRDGGGVMKLRILQIWMQQPDQQWRLIARQAVTLA